MLTFTYKIREYNEENNYIDVDFEDGSWSRIILHGAMPTNKEELDRLVSQFATHLKKPDSLDNSFIKDKIGKSLKAAVKEVQIPPPPAESSEMDGMQISIQDSEEKWVEDIVRRILIEKGLINE